MGRVLLNVAVVVGVLYILILLTYVFIIAPNIVHTNYESFTNNCELTGGEVIIPTLICPWYSPNCRQDMTVCFCPNLETYTYKEIKSGVWVGCPTQ